MKHTLALMLGIALVVAIGCTSRQQSDDSTLTAPRATDQSETTSTSDARNLLTIIIRGGRCEYGACYQTITIREDGYFEVVIGYEAVSTLVGEIGDDLTSQLQQAMNETDFAAIRSVPFTEDCPTAYDGSEFMFSFYTPNGVEEFSSCDYALDPQHPLIQIVNRVQEAIREQVQ